MKKFTCILGITLTLCLAADAQNVGINTTTPDPSSELDVTSSKKGFLAPRMTELQRDGITAPATGLLIYQTNMGPGFYVYDGTRWTPMNNADGLFTSDNNTVQYQNAINFGKSFLVNTETSDYQGSGLQSKMMFIPSKEGAFRVGAVSASDWDFVNIGMASFASGDNTKAKGDYSTAMGFHSVASGINSTAIGAHANASGKNSTAMGFQSVASGESSIVMGQMSMASGRHSFAIGAFVNATGDYSTAMGRSVSTGGKTGSFVFGDGTSNTLSNSADNQIAMRFTGGYEFHTSHNSYVAIAPGGNSWTTHSDSTKKENYKATDDFLSKIAQMKLGSWNYKGQDKTKFRHYGPMAQEFYAHFGHDGVGLIGCDTTIASADIDGVMMIAIQQLIRENNRLKANKDKLEQAMKEQNKQLSQRLSRLEAQLKLLLSTQK